MNSNTASSTTSLISATFGQPPLLPLEVWVEIFLLSLPAEHFTQAPHKTALALVCRFWNSIIESTPILWSKISIEDTPSYVRKSLLKSGRHPIDVSGVRLSDEEWLDAECDGTCCEFMENITKHSKRWRHAALKISCNQELYGPTVLKTPLQRLESLKLFSHGFGHLHNELPKLLKKENTPHLREVVLQSTELSSWDISFPPSLSKLVIRYMPLFQPSFIEVLSFILGCPNLAILHVSDTNISWDGPVVGPIVELASLQELKLEWLPQEVVQNFLGRLRFPDECTITIGCRVYDPSPSTSFLTPTLSHYYTKFDCADQIEELRVVLDEGLLYLEVVGERRWDINLELCGLPELEDSLEWFGINTENGNSISHSGDSKSHLGDSPTCFMKPKTQSVFLKLKQFPKEFEQDHLTSISNLECITNIEAPDRPEDQKRFLWYLSGHDYPVQPTTDPQNINLPEDSTGSQTTGIYPFPSLRQLVVKGMQIDVLRDVLSMVRSRWGSSATTGSAGKLAHVTRIEFVEEDDGERQGGDCRSALDPQDARFKLLLDLVLLLGKDAKVFWGGKRVS
ncbi:hypothetical protein FRC01_009807, partial [Tulasnella sp. 417]